MVIRLPIGRTNIDGRRIEGDVAPDNSSMLTYGSFQFVASKNQVVGFMTDWGFCKRIAGDDKF